MNYNPYASPTAQPQPPQYSQGGGGGGYGGRMPPVGDVLRQSWELFKQNAGVAIGSLFVVLFIIGIPMFGPTLGLRIYLLRDVVSAASSGARYGRPPLMPAEYFMWQPVLSLWTLVIGQIFAPGTTRMNVAIARNESPSMGIVFSGFDRVPAALGWALLVQTPLLLVQGLVAVLALADVGPVALQAFTNLSLLALLPIVVLQCLGLVFVPWFIVDRKLGPIAAAKAAWRATSNYRGETFLLMLALVGFNVLGCCAFCVGIFITAPWSMVAIAYAYAHLPQEQYASQG